MESNMKKNKKNSTERRPWRTNILTYLLFLEGSSNVNSSWTDGGDITATSSVTAAHSRFDPSTDGSDWMSLFRLLISSSNFDIFISFFKK